MALAPGAVMFPRHVLLSAVTNDSTSHYAETGVGSVWRRARAARYVGTAIRNGGRHALGSLGSLCRSLVRHAPIRTIRPCGGIQN